MKPTSILEYLQNERKTEVKLPNAAYSQFFVQANNSLGRINPRQQLFYPLSTQIQWNDRFGMIDVHAMCASPLCTFHSSLVCHVTCIPQQGKTVVSDNLYA